ncbi:OmpP1/FadL family transporter [Bacteroides sp.]|uniref:OmpP1/FadL family transporter n=1 Tax=Bacteroides sp. TaxID=29523 RepID=UPI002630C3AF|nr:outer membrane protein transport protein [Bacteroides sp.]MDD3036555.1 outer membrane protein transport protein [Bacteroides sp.]
MKKLYILPALLLLSGLASAQTVNDIVRYSTTTNTGSARSTAMGGAFGALGGDLSSIVVNPAGIGEFRKAEVSITPSLNIAKTKSDDRVSNQLSLQLGTLGGVFVFHNPNSSWRGFNLGINYNNLNNFNRTTSQYVYNSGTSFTEILALEANKYGASGGREKMALNAGLISFNNETGFFEPTLLPEEEVTQRKHIREDGYQGGYDLTFGANYKDKLYLGMTIGVQNIHYKFESVFMGKGDTGNFFGLDKYTVGQYLKTQGIGTNFKFGMIYRPIPELRIGAAVHSPTFFSMKDTYSEDAYSEFYEPDENNDCSYRSYITPATYNYDMQTPWKLVISAATVLMQKATLSVDYEYSNYTLARFSNGDDVEDFYTADGTGANDQIISELKATHNFRAGVEYRLNNTVSLRGGYAYWDSPYKMSSMPTLLRSNLKIQAISAGFGTNFGMFFIDAAYVCKFSKDITSFYFYQDSFDSADDIIANPLHNKYANHEGRITLGMRF